MKKLFASKKIILVFLAIVFIAFDFNYLPARADDVSDVQNQLEKYQDKKEEAQKQLNTAQTLLQKNQYQVGVTQGLIQKTESEIAKKESNINSLNAKITLDKKILEEYLREISFDNQNDNAMGFSVSGNLLSDFSENFDHMISVKEKVLDIMGEITSEKQELEKNKSDLAGKKVDHEELLNIQKGQQYQIKTDINEVQATLAQVNAKIDKLRSELSKLLGSAVSFKNVIDAAKFAAKVTGIRKDYLLGVLVVESNLGKYTGGCTFKESRMSSYRAGIFKNICKELDYNYQKMKVSCPPKSYAGTGGAMGVAQFMPDTWVGYKSSIASVTGHNPPDPWNLTDGVVAMALKLSKVSGVTDHKKSAEAKAYCVYLAGNNWAAYCDSKGTDYGDLVLYWADNYERLID